MSTTIPSTIPSTTSVIERPRRRRRRLALLTLVASLASMFALAVPAGAATVETDSVMIPGADLDFGEGGLLFGIPLSGGTLTWDAGGGDISATLTGRLYIDRAGECGRIRLVGYNAAGAQVAAVNGGTVCAAGAGVSSWSVNKTISHVDLDEVRTVLQVLNSSGGYSLIGDVYRSIQFDNDLVKLTGSDLDFGRNGLIGGSPVNSGNLDWGFDSGDVTANLTGTLYIDRAGECGRVRLVGYDTAGAQVAAVNGGTVCASGSGVSRWTVDKTISHQDLYKVKVVLQVQNAGGGYSLVDSEFEYI